MTTRRDLVKGGLALGAAPLFGLTAPAFAQGKAVTLAMGVGLNSNGGPIPMLMQREGLLAAEGKKLGLEIDAQYQEFQALLRMLQGLVAKQLQVGSLGSTPTIRFLSVRNPGIPVALVGGGVDLPLQVPVGSPVRNLDDLRGKTVLTAVGSDMHMVLLNLVRARFGTTNLKELGITLKNITAVTELFEPQPGIDAVCGFDPNSFAAQQSGKLVTLIHNNGRTGLHYKGPEGEGAGHELAYFKQAVAYPEAFYPHRIWFVVHRDLAASQPDVVVALLSAAQAACRGLASWTPERIGEMMGDKWAGDAAAKKRIVDMALWRERGFVWPTESDYRTLLEMSKFKDVFEAPIAPEDMRKMLGEVAPLMERAWKASGDPEIGAFSKTTPRDARGLPVWRLQDWKI